MAGMGRTADGPLSRHRDQLGHLAEVLGGRGEEELVFCAFGTSQAQSIQLQDAFEVRKQHLDLLPLSTGRHIRVRGGNIAGQVTSAFVDGARDLAGRHVGRAASPQVAVGAVLLAGAIADGAVLADIAAALREVAVAGAQAITGRTDIAVVAQVIAEVRRAKVPSLRVDLSNTGMCGWMSRSWTSHASISAEP